MPDPDATIFERTYEAGQKSVSSLLRIGGYSIGNKEIVSVKVANPKQPNFFVLSSGSFSGNLTMTFSSKINLKQDHETTMAILGPNNGEFIVENTDGSSEIFSVKTESCSRSYISYTTTKDLSKSLEAYFKNVRPSVYNSNLKEIGIDKNDILFCIVSPNGKGATIKNKGKNVKLKEFSFYGNHSPTSQSTLGKTYMIKKGDLSKVTINIPKDSKSYGFFITAPAIDINYPDRSLGCWVAFSGS